MRDASRKSSINDVQERSYGYMTFTALYVLLFDIVMYGSLVPLLCTYLAGSCVMFGVTPRWEVVLTVGFTFTASFLSFTFMGESSYWKRLFAFDRFYTCLLTVRDVVNSFTLIICLVGIASTVEQMVADKSMKSSHMNEGSSYVFMKTLLKWLHIDHNTILPPLGLKLPHGATFTDPNFGENERFELAGNFMVLWAMLAASIAKLVYFNTLFTYLRAMNIFISLKPVFEEEESAHTLSK